MDERGVIVVCGAPGCQKGVSMKGVDSVCWSLVGWNAINGLWGQCEGAGQVTPVHNDALLLMSQ